MKHIFQKCRGIKEWQYQKLQKQVHIERIPRAHEQYRCGAGIGVAIVLHFEYIDSSKNM